MTRKPLAVKRQVNLPLEGEAVLALQLLLAREQLSCPALLVPVVEEYVISAVRADPDLSRALDGLLTSRRKAEQLARQKVRPLRRR